MLLNDKTIYFRCITNCGEKVTLSKPMTLEAVCSKNCISPYGGVQHKWSLVVEDIHGDFTDFDNLENIAVGGE